MKKSILFDDPDNQDELDKDDSGSEEDKEKDGNPKEDDADNDPFGYKDELN